MRYSILRYGHPMLTGIDGFEEAKKEAFGFVAPIVGSDFLEIRDSGNETVTIGYYDGRRFHWTEDKSQTEAWKDCGYVTKPSLWCKEVS